MHEVTTTGRAGAAPEFLALAEPGAAADLADLAKLDCELPCRTYDADLWFADTPADLERAKAHCAECPIREACLRGALARSEPWGVWGGEIFERGVVIGRKRPSGRPRKNEIAA